MFSRYSHILLWFFSLTKNWDNFKISRWHFAFKMNLWHFCRTKTLMSGTMHLCICLRSFVYHKDFFYKILLLNVCLCICAYIKIGFTDGVDGKESPCNVGYPGSIPGLQRSTGKDNGHPAFLPGEFLGQRSLAGYSSWDCKELDMTERLTFSLSYFSIF